MNHYPSTMILSPGQRKAAEILRGIIRLATGNLRRSLPLSTRTNTLIAGRSGSGKSHLVRALAIEAGIPLWEMNVSNWIVLGARNGGPTLDSLISWIDDNDAGIIFLDELEKISDSNPWYNSIRLEIHSICDGNIPESALSSADIYDMSDLSEDISLVRQKALIKAKLGTKLRTTFAIIGAGAWQREWTRAFESIGFQSTVEEKPGLSRKQLLTMISPEVLQRFRHDIVFIEPMTLDDYSAILASQAECLPEWQRNRFIELVTRAFPRAIEDGLGMRIFEEVYTDLCLELETTAASPIPETLQAL